MSDPIAPTATATAAVSSGSIPPAPPPPPPPLPLSLITTLLPHLLPPGPLPQEFLCKSLLQRLLYIPPSADDLDSHLTPFPPSSRRTDRDQSINQGGDDEENDDDVVLGQPISSRLKELSHGHRLSEVVYTREEEEVYAKVEILPEEQDVRSEVDDNGRVEIWFEFETLSEGGNGRGWVYHSARIPLPLPLASSSSSSAASATTTMTGRFYPNPESLPLASSLQENANAERGGGGDSTEGPSLLLDDGEAPAGYWAAFDSPPPQDQLSLSLGSDRGQHEDEHAEDAYWAQYSRPATAPITPPPMTPGGPLNPASATSTFAPGAHLDIDTDTHGSRSGGGRGSGSGSAYDISRSSSNGFGLGRGGIGMKDEKEILAARKLAESLRSLGLQDNQYNTKPGLVANGSDFGFGFGFGLGNGNRYDHNDNLNHSHTQNGCPDDLVYVTDEHQSHDHDHDHAHNYGSPFDTASAHTNANANADVTKPQEDNQSPHPRASIEVNGRPSHSRSGSASTSRNDGETGVQVKDRLRGKIAHALNVLWKEYCPRPSSSSSSTSPHSFDHDQSIGHDAARVDLDLDVDVYVDVDPGMVEERALSWLRLARGVLDAHSQPQPQPQPQLRKVGVVYPGSGGGGDLPPPLLLEERVHAKLETLWEMYSVLQEGQEASQNNFYRLVEGVIKRTAASVPGHEEDEVMRQETYYE
ncbi:hypothetical protein I316_06230 [Kwoniella heveanensis BCC8398]|uniref:Uncharacterized protein n=1 Tax=Kwoniella heveanensis BCC8398 TaxID=1296120 RepID=A0A1B9GLU7_9TREE|nr:hypothetical protein I316_06230 [Kwoniella heveanensis BCC8398]